ncbi:hypothetical protein ACFXJ5_17040 [Streptomyces sp. NPDC059373]
MTLLRSKPEPLVSVAEVAAELGVEVLEPRLFGFDIDPDGSMSLVDAWKLIDRVRQVAAGHDRAWAAFLAACQRWESDRTEAFRNAATEARTEVLRAGHGPGRAQDAAGTAGCGAAEAYERTAPRPMWQGEAGPGNCASLMYVPESEAARPTSDTYRDPV